MAQIEEAASAGKTELNKICRDQYWHLDSES